MADQYASQVLFDHSTLAALSRGNGGSEPLHVGQEASFSAGEDGGLLFPAPGAFAEDEGVRHGAIRGQGVGQAADQDRRSAITVGDGGERGIVNEMLGISLAARSTVVGQIVESLLVEQYAVGCRGDASID
jgi:hypothetical protein